MKKEKATNCSITKVIITRASRQLKTERELDILSRKKKKMKTEKSQECLKRPN